MVREIFNDGLEEENKYKISKNIFIILQHFIEQYICKLFYNSNFLAIHAGRVKVTSIDIAFAAYLNGELKNPYNNPEEETNNVSEETNNVSESVEEELYDYNTDDSSAPSF